MRCPTFEHQQTMKVMTRYRFEDGRNYDPRDQFAIEKMLEEGENELSNMERYHNIREEKEAQIRALSSASLSPETRSSYHGAEHKLSQAEGTAMTTPPPPGHPKAPLISNSPSNEEEPGNVNASLSIVSDYLYSLPASELARLGLPNRKVSVAALRIISKNHALPPSQAKGKAAMIENVARFIRLQGLDKRKTN